MRKSLIAKSIAALVGGLGLAAGANAAVFDPNGGVAFGPIGGVTQATVLEVNTDDIGHINIVPYYSTQSGNDTYINITNQDTKNGKAVKVRFRAAANSDDVYDITVLMSPGDIWAAAITKDAATGLPKLVHNDKTCTLPFNVKGNFVTTRLDSTLTAAGKAEQASEGYVEILNMADIPYNAAAGSLYATIKHNSSGVAACNTTAAGALALDALFTDSTDYANAVSKGLAVPTTGLATNWTVINVPKAAAYSGNAVAVEARVAAGGAAGYGNIVLFPQAATPVAAGLVPNYTSDPVLRQLDVAAAMFDFPDLSTPYLFNNVNPLQQASDLTGSLAVTSVANEFVTDTSILAKTSWVFSMPTRRYSVAYNYAGANDAARLRFSVLPVDYFTAANTTISGRQICVSGLQTATAINPATIAEPDNRIGAVTADREERTLVSPTEFVISPGAPAAPLTFCGEVSVLNFNGTNAIGATVTVKDLTVPYADGWLRIATPGLAGVGLPIVGHLMTELFNSAATPGVAGAYGQTFPHRKTRP